MLKKCTFRFLFTLLAMAGMSAAAYNGTPTAKANFATETINSKNCYKIGSAEDLYGFAAIVNGTNGNTAEPTVCGVLTADITVNENVLTSAGELNTALAGGFIEWTPIGKTTLSTAFKGTFYGQGHTISGLYFNNPETDYVGLFAYTTGTVSIDGVGVVDSYFRGKDNVGGLVGYHYNMQSSVKLSVKNSYNAGFVTGTSKVGGLVGGNYRNLSIVVENSYNTGSVNGSSNVGGLVGVNGNIYFSYNTGSVTGNDNVGGLVGSARSNQIIDCYNVGPVKEGDGVGNALLGEGCEEIASGMNNSFYLEGSGSECGSQSFSKTSEEFANGYVALELHNNTAATGASIWGQIVGTDKTPLLTGEIKFLLNDGCFEIANEEDLYLFAAAVNNGVDSKVCAKLTADIKVNEHVLADASGVPKVNSDGAYTGSTTDFRVWTPIGNFDHPFIGTFDGDGHTISGLYFDDGTKENVGLFGYVESRSGNVEVSIKNVGLEDSYFKAGGNVGGIVGLVGDNVDVKIENVYNAAAVTDGGSGYVGGIVGEFWTYEPSTLNILNSYNSGAVFGNNSVGGLVGDVDDRTSASTVSIKNSYNYGAVTAFDNQGETLVGSVAGTSVNISDTYYLKNSALKSSHGGTEMSSTQFSDGTVLAALSNAEGGEVWRQYSGDAYPTFVKKSGTTFEPNEDGYYEIATAEDLYKFAEIVNNGTAVGSGTELGVKAKLIADICVNACGEGESVLKADGSLNGDGSSFTPWTPIGIAGNPFIGTFDGQGHTISGLYFNDANEINVGLFGDVTGDGETVSISNIGIEDSYFKAGSGVGGVVGYAEFVALDMKNVFNAAVVEGYSFVGGVVGFVSLNENQTSIMVNVYNVGSINGMDADAGQAGGLVGDFMNDYVTSMLTIKNSYNYGDVAGGNPLVGKVENEYENVSVTNSFYKGSSSSGDYGTVKSSDEFADGTVYAALHSGENVDVWFLKPGDKYPTLSQEKNGPAVYEVTLNYPKAGSTSEYDPETISYVEGFAKSLPTIDKEGYPILGWYDAGNESSPITEIPATATGTMTLFPKLFVPFVNGCYEIATAEQLYWFAATVNKGNVNACGKLTANIEVNQNVLATADGVSKVNADGSYDTASGEPEKIWTPIGNGTNPFQGTFDGQGHTISGLYFNGENVYDVGLFGRVAGDDDGASVTNVNVADSYFGDKGETGDHVGGIVGMVAQGGTVAVKNVSSAAVVVGNDDVGGIVGYVLGTEGNLDLDITNAYHVGMVKGSDDVGGLVGDVTIDRAEHKVAINNSYNYGDVSFKMTDGGAPLIGSVKNTAGVATIDVDNSYYLGNAAQGDYGTNKSVTEFADGTVLVALRSGEDGYVWVQAPGDKYPTIDINASPTADIVVLDWSTAADSTTLADARYTDGDVVVVKGGKQFYADGKIYEGILSAEQVTAIGENKLYPIGGVKLENVGDKLVATLNGNSDETLVIPMDIAVSKVVYQRDLTGGVFQTIMLPFDAQVTSRSDVTFYKFKEVTADYNVKVSTVTQKILANKPYIVVAHSNISQIEFEGSLTLVKATSEIYEARKDDWVLKGVYKTKVFENEDPEIGRAYGFAGQQVQNTKIGEFVKVGSDAYANPMRVYLVFDPVSQARPGQNGVSGFARVRGVPESLAVIIDDEEEKNAEEETTVVKRIMVVPTVGQSNRWFDMKGRALGAKPTAKGIYYYNGQRVIIK